MSKRPCVRIDRRERARLGRELAEPRPGDAAIDVPVPHAPQVHEQRARRADRHGAIEVAPHVGLVRGHLRADEPAVRLADLLGRPFEVHLAHAAAQARPGFPEARHPAGLDGRGRRRGRDHRRLDPRRPLHREVRDERERGHGADRDERARPLLSHGAARGACAAPRR